MDSSITYRLLADAILLLHVLFVAFVVFGLILIYAGGWRNWAWVHNPWFRITHLVAIGIVIAQSWLGVLCPLTGWEMALRERAGDAVYSGSFIAHWLQSLLYYDAPWWLFTLCYTLFGLLVIASWFQVRPRSFGRNETNGIN